MPEWMIDEFRVLEQSWGNQAATEKEILFRQKMKGGDLKSFKIETLETDSVWVSAEVDEESDVFKDRPVDKVLLLVPEKDLKSHGPLTEAKSSVVVIWGFFDIFPNFIQTESIFLFAPCFI